MKRSWRLEEYAKSKAKLKITLWIDQVPCTLDFLQISIEICHEIEFISRTCVILQFWKKLMKNFKNCSLETLFWQKQGQYGSHPDSSSILCLEITERLKFSRTFCFIIISYVLTDSWMIFYTVWYFVNKKGHFQSKQLGRFSVNFQISQYSSIHCPDLALKLNENLFCFSFAIITIQYDWHPPRPPPLCHLSKGTNDKVLVAIVYW